MSNSRVKEFLIALTLVIAIVSLIGLANPQNRLWNGLLLATQQEVHLDPGEAVFVVSHNISVVNDSGVPQTITPALKFWLDVAWDHQIAPKQVSIILVPKINPEDPDPDYILPITYDEDDHVVLYYVGTASGDPNFGLLTAIFYVRHVQKLMPDPDLPESRWTITAAAVAWEFTATTRQLDYAEYVAHPFGFTLSEADYAQRLEEAESYQLPIK